jgi:hypothetical protein
VKEAHVNRALVVLIALAAALVLALPAAGVGGSTPAVGTAAETVDLSGVAGSRAYGGGWAIPLRGQTPAWYTPELAAQVHEAAGEPVAAPAAAPLPGEVGIRPGSWMISPSGCTMNFVFASGGSFAIGTAGHCASRGDPVVLLTLAPGVENPVLVEIGTVSVSHDNGIGDDFALVPIRPALNAWVDPTIAIVGGPCGTYSGSGPETVWHYGHGLGIGTGGTPRAGVALTWQANAFGWSGAAIFGDSGSPVRVGTGLAAAGDLTHLVVDTTWLPSFIAGTRIGKIQQIAGGWSLLSGSPCL